jgi:hypothetical protein
MHRSPPQGGNQPTIEASMHDSPRGTVADTDITANVMDYAAEWIHIKLVTQRQAPLARAHIVCHI